MTQAVKVEGSDTQGKDSAGARTRPISHPEQHDLGIRIPVISATVAAPLPSLSDSSTGQSFASAATGSGSENEGNETRNSAIQANGIESLLEFVSEAGNGIKATLDRSAPCKRSVDPTKFMQRQLESVTETNGALWEHELEERPLHPVCNVQKNRHLNTELIPHWCMDKKTSPFLDNSTHMQAAPIPPRQISQDTSIDMDKDPLFQDIPSSPNGADSKTSVGGQRGLPLRQRQLPASFWIEPNKPRHPCPPDDICAAMVRLNRAQSGYDWTAPGLYRADTLDQTYFFRSQQQAMVLDNTAGRKMASLSTLSGDICKPSGDVGVIPGSYTVPGSGVRERHSVVCCPASAPLQTWAYKTSPTTHLSQPQMAAFYPRNHFGLETTATAQYNDNFMSRQQLWKPIPTKSTTSFARYHPFANVH